MNVLSVLDAVTVYREGALCTRVARVAADQVIPQQVRVVGLPMSLTPGSLRARISGAGEVRVLDVRAAFDVVFADALDAPKELKAVQAADEVLATLSSELNQLQNEISELQNLKPQPLEHKVGAPPREAAVDATLALADFVEGRLVTRLAKRRELQRKVDDAREAATLARRRLNEASTSVRTERAQVTRSAVISLSGPISNTAVEISVEYLVPGARWVPNYQLRLAKGFSGGTLMMRASIAQNSGEDWSRVSLALSTASINRRADVPELKSLRIGRTQLPPPRSGWREPPQGLDALFEAYDATQTGLRRQEPAPEVSAAPVFASQAMSIKAAKPKMAPAPMAPPPPAPTAAPRGGFGGTARSLGAASVPPPPMISRSRSMMKKEASVEEDDMEDAAPAMMESSADMSSFGEGGGGYQEEEKAIEPGNALGDDMRDYDSLAMSGFESDDSQRGRLHPASPWHNAFALGVSVQVDVVMLVLNAARSKANDVAYLSVPPGCQPVSSFQQFDYRFDCQGRLDVPSSGKWVTVSVMACEVGLKPQYVCVPSIEPKVYRTLAIDNATTHALLPGPVDVSAGDEFLMTTALPAIAPGSNAERLGLGVEEAIKVARKTQYTETTGGFLGGSAVLPHEVSIEINNRLSVPAALEVRERVPWPDPSEKDVKLEETKVTPAWEKIEKPIDGVLTQGARRWLVTVPAGQTTTLLAQYTIRIPADRMLVGGNRRS